MDIKAYNEMIDRTNVQLWKRRNKFIKEETLKNMPLGLLNVDKIFKTLVSSFKLDNEISQKVKEKLIDIKTLYFFLDNSEHRFYLGSTLIVGNGELDKVDEKTISLIQAIHYKIYLISCLYEKLLEFFELIHLGKISDTKNNKWGKIFGVLKQLPDFKSITSEDNNSMLDFRDRFRRGEIHGISSVFRLLDKDKWILPRGEQIVKRITQSLYIQFINVENLPTNNV